jgi:hypothetical protein
MKHFLNFDQIDLPAGYFELAVFSFQALEELARLRSH